MIIWWLCRSINADSSERLSRRWILLQFADMTLSLFAICLRFPDIKNKNKKFIVDPNTNSYIIQIHQINQ